MKRFLILTLSLFLLAPSFCCGYFWWRSCSQTDDIFRYSPGRMTRLRSSGGGFWFETRPWEATTAPKLDWQIFPDRALYPFDAGPDASWYERWGISVNTRDDDLLLAAPYWLVLLLTAPLPLWWMWRQFRRPAIPAKLPDSTP